ncbi:hypothetical protein PGIGA_G00199510 [Pangasianodon gigas]|uniref:Uncharacterized protein n=1 Tax=Pangasianodon gigas TaxID=30993 RepID=A0ACC5WEG2_PANGG|nr:hypothetical protein [Pangasianodon gigas]
MHTGPTGPPQTPLLLPSIFPSLTYIRMLFIDYSSAFNTVIPHKLAHKLFALGLHPTLCDWLLDFLTGRPQSVRIGKRTSDIIITNIGTPQGCVLSPILYTLFTHDCVASHKDNIIAKFADDTTVIGQITGGDEAAYRREVASLVTWCEDNNLTLNTDKTKEMIVDMKKERRTHQPLFIRELEVERLLILIRLCKSQLDTVKQKAGVSDAVHLAGCSMVDIASRIRPPAWTGLQLSEDEYQLIKALIRAHDTQENPTWIGLTGCQKRNNFFWSDGTKLTFTKWNPGQPDFLPGECCVHMNWPCE